jgi:hypothetical protein
MSAAHMLSMDFDHKAPFLESSFDSSFNYMDNYFQYPPPSPTLGVSVGRQFFVFFLLVRFSRFYSISSPYCISHGFHIFEYHERVHLFITVYF